MSNSVERAWQRPKAFGRFSSVVAALVLPLLLASLPGCANLGRGAKPFSLNSTERMMWSTYPLATPKGMATGFVVTERNRSHDGSVTCMVVTSLHVLDTIGAGPLSVGFRVPDAQGEPQVAVLQLQPKGNAHFYVRHPQQDVGAFQIEIPAEMAKAFTLPSFVDDKSIGRSRDLPRAGTDVSFVGFPDVAPGTAGAFPVLRSGKVASYPVGALQQQRKFLINSDVYPGDSGAPVFASGFGGKPKLMGMIIQRIGKDPRSFAHFAIAVDASAIRETVELLQQSETQDSASTAKVPEKKHEATSGSHLSKSAAVARH